MKLTLLLFFASLTLLGQNIKGTILDRQTKTPLENVHVFIKSKRGTTSNENGEFNLNIKISKSDTIKFSIIGYSSKKYTLNQLKESNYIVYLSKKIENLNEVIVRSNKQLKAKISYKKLASLRLGLHSFASTLIDSKIYTIGGDASTVIDASRLTLNEMGNNPEAEVGDLLEGLRRNSSWENYSGKSQVYDITNDTWTTPKLKFRQRAHSTLNYANNKLYVIGGKRLSINRKYEYLDEKLEVLDLKNNTIILDDTNPHQAVNFDSFVYNDNIIVMGGSTKLDKDGKKTYTNKSHIYNTSTGYWYELNNMLYAKETKGVLIDNKIYLIGGFNDKPLTEIESYNLSTGQWTKEGELFSGIENPALTYHANTVYIFNDGKILTYNIITNELTEYNISLNLKASELFYYKDKIYLLGGYSEDEFTKTPSTGLYSIDLSEFLNTKIVKHKNL